MKVKLMSLKPDQHKVTDVFTPTRSATLTFVERKDLNERLVDAIRTPGKQLVIYGHSGSGKTTLLRNKLDQLYEHQIWCRCTNDTTFTNLLLEAFDKIDPFFIEQITKESSNTWRTALEGPFKAIKIALASETKSSESSTTKRVLPPQLTPARLADFLGATGAVWVVEDFHKVADIEKTRLAQTMKLFMDAAADWPEVKIVAIGAADTARDVIKYDSEMSNRVAEVYVPLMERDELIEIASKRERLLNIVFGQHFKESIAEFSSGLAAVYHQMCLNACFAADIDLTCRDEFQITPAHLKRAIERYLSDCSDSLKRAFQRAYHQKRASKWDNGKEIIHALSTFGGEGATHNEIFNKVRERCPDYPSGNLTSFLRQLQSEDRGEIVRYDHESRKYSFSNPIYRAYAQMQREQVTPLKQGELFDRADEWIEILRQRLEQKLAFSQSVQVTVQRPDD